jgi:hypothetical protein
MTTKDKILIFLENTGIKKDDFFEKTGIAASNFKGIGLKSELGGEKLIKILTIYQDLSPDWLLTGTGSMLRKQNVQNKEITPNDTVDSDAYLQDKDTDNVVIEQKKDTIIEELLNRLEKQSEVIGALKQENTQLRRQLQKKSNQHYPDATDAECAAAV